MKISVVLEAVSSIVYHMAGFGAAAGIAKSDSLVSREAISFTRSMTGAYHQDNRLIGVIYEVDGSKLNQNYKGGPVGTEDFSTGEYHGRDNRQLEDRVYTKAIKNFSKYIRDVYIYIPLDYLSSSRNEFEEHYAEELNVLPEVISLLKNRYGDLKFILSERGLSNKKYYNSKAAIQKISEAIKEYDLSDELSENTLEFFGMGPNYYLVFQVRLECHWPDGECHSDSASEEAKKAPFSGKWDEGFSQIPFDGKLDNLGKTISNVTPEMVAKYTTMDAETGYDASELLGYRFLYVTKQTRKDEEEEFPDPEVISDHPAVKAISKEWRKL